MNLDEPYLVFVQAYGDAGLYLSDLQPDQFVVLMTAYGTMRTAIDAMKEGAFDYITKPFESDQIYALIDKAVLVGSYRHEVDYLKAEMAEMRRQIQAQRQSYEAQLADLRTKVERLSRPAPGANPAPSPEDELAAAIQAANPPGCPAEATEGISKTASSRSARVGGCMVVLLPVNPTAGRRAPPGCATGARLASVTPPSVPCSGLGGR